jgi:beta-lactamase regulating signal transducer with metallopeptidase domain
MNPAIDLVGSLLLHFLWQGLAIAAIAAVLLRLLRSSIPQVRYLVACMAMLGMLVAPLLTARILSHPNAVTQPQLRGQRLIRLEVIGQTRGMSDARMLPIAAAPPPRAATTAEKLVAAAVGVWLLGVVLLLIRLAGGWWQVWRLRQTALALEVSAWQEAADRLARRLRVTRAVRVVDSMLVDTPTLIGWLTPVVMLPIAALANLTPAQVEAILAHELAHVRRHDFLVNVLQAITETLFFYHPAVWWISSRVRIEREHCCDDVALMVSGDAVGYASALAELETWRATDRRLALAATDGTLAARIRRLLMPPGVGDSATASAAFVTAIVIAAGIAGTVLYSVGAVRAQTPDAADRARTELRVQWRRTSTDHFDISAPPDLAARVAMVGADAERAYMRVSGDLRTDLSTRPLIVLFESQAAMERMRGNGLIPPPRVASSCYHSTAAMADLRQP